MEGAGDEDDMVGDEEDMEGVALRAESGEEGVFSMALELKP